MFSTKYVLGGLGLLLAALDFFALDDILERALERFRSTAKRVGTELRDNYRQEGLVIFFFVAIPAVSLVLISILWLGYLTGLLPGHPVLFHPADSKAEVVWQVLQIVISLPLAISIFLWLLWYPLDLMTRTPRGIVGSLGLILALAGFFV